ncbi:MAG: hypothetical protein JXA93_01245, partial [Anaerolineae bacterium]|nr:hypothetical protein [Anaerolineae bacterium]
MKHRQAASFFLSLLIVLSLLLSGLPGNSVSLAQGIVIDGVKEAWGAGLEAALVTIDGVVDAAYGAPLASDSAADGGGNDVMDLVDLYVTEDADYYYLAFTIDA